LQIGASLTWRARYTIHVRGSVPKLSSRRDYNVQPQGETPADFLASDNSGGLSGFIEALNDVYQVVALLSKTQCKLGQLR
jgi:hypothetical protein